LPNTLPISFSPSPRCHRSQISALSAAVNLRLCLIIHLTSSMVKCCNDQLNPRVLSDVTWDEVGQLEVNVIHRPREIAPGARFPPVFDQPNVPHNFLETRVATDS